MDELDKAGSFKFPEVSEGLKKLLKEQEETRKEVLITNNLLCAICDLKETQQDSDNVKHAAWKRQKDQSTILSLVAIFIAGLALTVTTDVDVVAVAAELFNSVKDLI